jgi:hypothetical protein
MLELMRSKISKGLRKPAAKSVKPAAKSVKPAANSAKSAANSAKSAAKSAKPAVESVKAQTASVAARNRKAVKAVAPALTVAKAKVAPAKAPRSTPVPPTLTVAKAKGTSRITRLKIPPILLEGDAPPAPAVSGPGQRYVLSPTPAAAPVVASGAQLPESYGTKQLFLAARDPHWLYAHWDFSREQLKKYNALSTDGHLVLRVYRGAVEGDPLSQIHLHPESRNWFIPVPDAGAKYLAELGYQGSDRKWVSLTRSGATLTPPDSLSEDTSVRFATIPPEVPFAELLAMVKGAVRQHVPLVEAMQQMRAKGFRNLPAPEEIKHEWTPAQEQALGEVISIDQLRRVWIGSLEITELIRRQLQEQASSAGAAQFSLPSSAMGALSSVSSPFGGAQRQRGFWFNVNAELIIYGATEPDAKVTIGDRPIKLRPDGSFSFRFALPDGHYSLPAAAHSADGVETRRAKLKFSRETAYDGEVGAHPQDRNLKPPLISAVA